MGKSSDYPDYPDPYETADAQTEYNEEATRLETTINRYDQVTPYGTLKWSQAEPTFDERGYKNALADYETQLAAYNAALASGGGTGGQTITYDSDGTPIYGTSTDSSLVAPTAVDKNSFYDTSNQDKWTSTIELDPRVQALVDADLATSQGLAETTQSALGRAQDEFGKGIDTTNITKAAETADVLAQARGGITSVNNDVARAQTVYDRSTNAALHAVEAAGSKVADGLSYDSLGPMPSANEAARKAIEEAYYQKATSRLDPQYQQAESDLASRLAAQGITQGSEAYNREMMNLSRAKTDAYGQATNSAITNSTSELAKLYGMELAGRQQGATELTNEYGMPTAQAAQLASIADNSGKTLQGMYGTQLNQGAAAPQIAQALYNLQTGDRQYDIQEQTNLRTQLLNELNALRTGSQATMPSFTQQQTASSVDAANYMQAVNNAYTAEVGAYNADVASSNSLLNGLTGLGSAALGMFNF